MSSQPPKEGDAALVEVRGLVKRFGRKVALDHLNLELRQREIVGIVGADGAGKTTLIRSLAGLLEVEADSARVLGYDLKADVTALKARIGYVPQAFGMHRDLSVMENLRFTARLQRLSSEVFERRVTELLQRTALAPFAQRAAGALSGGMKQKLAVINALLGQPELLLLDEPTAGVDVAARAEIWNMLERATSETLVVISTSYLEEAEACDRLLYLDNGRIIADGRPAELMASVPAMLYRAWSADPRRVARNARRLPYVRSTNPSGRFARIQVDRHAAPTPDRVRADIADIAESEVYLIEQLPIDMEAALLHFAGAHTEGAKA